MTSTVKQFIQQSGFSNTYEQERLEKLCKIVAEYCIKQYQREASVALTEPGLRKSFGLDEK